MEKFIQDIQNRITNTVSAILYADEDWGQLDYYSPAPPVKWPCALIDILSIQWENIGNKGQLGFAQVRVKIADMRISNSSGKAPDSQKNKAYSFYTLTQAVFVSLHGWYPGAGYTALIRLSEKRVQRDDAIKQHEMIFTVEIKDMSAVQIQTTPKPTVVFNTGLIHPE